LNVLRIFILLLALGAGGFAAWLTLAVQSPREAMTIVTPPPSIPTVEVLVASADLAQGQALTDANIRWVPWPKDAMSPGFISRPDRADALTALSGSVVRSAFLSGEPIREEKLARLSSGLLAAMLPSGKRAVAIRVSAENTAGGFILPNDRVDVIQTVARQGQAENLSRTILSNIRVLAVDQRADEAKGQAVVVGKTATLELSPEQAEVIASGQASGLLSLALRSVTDSSEEPLLRPQSSKSVRILRAGRSEVVNIQ
jgi:pilus assembly protein CpaB